MTKEKKKTMTPKVRFPEFRDAGDWEEKTLGDKEIALFVKEKMPFEKLTLESYISTENLLPDYAGTTTASKLPPSGSFTKFKSGDILISNIRPYLKKVWVADKVGAASNDVIVIRGGAAVSETFLSFLLKNDSFINYVMEGAKGLKMPRGDKSLMEEYRIVFPNKPEQQKIASTLTSLDDLITAQSEKIKALQAHKKGLMQQLFPAEGERAPRVRFGEFEGSGEWDFMNGDEVFNQISNKSHNSDLPILAITQEYGAIPRDEIDYSVIVTAKSVESYKVVDIGDFIISLRSFQGGIEYSNYKGICSPAYIILRKKIDIEDIFFKYYFKTDFFIQDMSKNIEGIRDGKMVTYKQFSDLLLPIPSKNEQQKIASTLTSLDDLITTQHEKLEALKMQKKGLMQQLFPNPNDEAI
jgi:type I restriction enzyme S subunit